MKFLPVVDRELRVLARRKDTFTVRTVSAAAGAMLFMGLAFLSSAGGIPAMTRGAFLMNGLAYPGMVFCLVTGSFLTADCLSRERSEGTLELLFLTPLRTHDILLGKLTASSLNAFYSLAGLLPVAALMLFWGGVTLWEVVRLTLVLLNAMFFSLAIGILVSSYRSDARGALFDSLVIMGALSGLPFLISGWLMELASLKPYEAVLAPCLQSASPFSAMINAGLARLTTFKPDLFWVSLAVSHLTAWSMVCVASRLLPARTLPKVQSRMVKTESASTGERSALHRKKSSMKDRSARLDVNPYYWASSRGRHKQLSAWIFLGGLASVAAAVRVYEPAIFAGLVALLLYIAAGFFKLWLTAEIVTRIQEERKAGSFELLLTTPLKPSDLMNGATRALWRQFAGPVITLMLAALWLLYRRALNPELFDGAAFHFVFWPLLIAFFVDVLALRWAAAGAALRRRSSANAIGFVAAWVLALPWGLMFLAMLTQKILQTLGLVSFRDSIEFHHFVTLGVLAGLILDGIAWRKNRNLFLNHLGVLAAYGFQYKRASLEWTAQTASRRGTDSKRRRIPWPRSLAWRMACVIIAILALVLIVSQLNRYRLHRETRNRLASPPWSEWTSEATEDFDALNDRIFPKTTLAPASLSAALILAQGAGPAKFNNPTMKNCRKILEANQASLAELDAYLRELADGKGFENMQLLDPRNQAVNVDNFITAMRSRMLLACMEKDAEEAYRTINAFLRVIHGLRPQEIIGHPYHLKRFMHIAGDLLRHLLNAFDLSEEQLAELQRHFHRMESYWNLDGKLRPLLNYGVRCFQPDASNFNLRPPVFESVADFGARSYRFIGGADRDFLRFLEYGATLKTIENQLPNARAYALFTEANESLSDAAQEIPIISPFHAWRRAFHQINDNIAYLDRARLSQTALAVRRYLLQYGKLPGALEELNPQFLPFEPVDLKTLQPLKYQALPHGRFHVQSSYSITWFR